MLLRYSGLAWHTEDTTLRQKFEEFGAIEEAVRLLRNFFRTRTRPPPLQRV